VQICSENAVFLWEKDFGGLFGGGIFRQKSPKITAKTTAFSPGGHGREL
jgi:hypothetical protein